MRFSLTLCDPCVRVSSVSRACPGSPRCLFPVRMQSPQNVREARGRSGPWAVPEGVKCPRERRADGVVTTLGPADLGHSYTGYKPGDKQKTHNHSRPPHRCRERLERGNEIPIPHKDQGPVATSHLTACDRQRGLSLSFFFPTHHPPAGRSARREPAAPARTPGITQGLQLKGQPARNSNTTIGTGAHSGPACITKWGVLIMATTKVSSITAGRFRQLLTRTGFRQSRF